MYVTKAISLWEYSEALLNGYPRLSRTFVCVFSQSSEPCPKDRFCIKISSYYVLHFLRLRTHSHVDLDYMGLNLRQDHQVLLKVYSRPVNA